MTAHVLASIAPTPKGAFRPLDELLTKFTVNELEKMLLLFVITIRSPVLMKSKLVLGCFLWRRWRRGGAMVSFHQFDFGLEGLEFGLEGREIFRIILGLRCLQGLVIFGSSCFTFAMLLAAHMERPLV